MLQEIQPKKLVNTYRVGEKADADSIILFHDNGRFLARIDEKEKTITYPRLKDFGVELSTVFLFSIDDFILEFSCSLNLEYSDTSKSNPFSLV